MTFIFAIIVICNVSVTKCLPDHPERYVTAFSSMSECEKYLSMAKKNLEIYSPKYPVFKGKCVEIVDEAEA